VVEAPLGLCQEKEEIEGKEGKEGKEVSLEREVTRNLKPSISLLSLLFQNKIFLLQFSSLKIYYLGLVLPH